MARQSEDMGTRRFLRAKGRVVFGAVENNPGHRCEGFNVIHNRGASKQSLNRRKRRLDTRLAFFTFEGFQKSGFLTANVSSRAPMNINFQIKPRTLNVFAQIAFFFGLIDSNIQPVKLLLKLTADIDIGGMTTNGKAGTDNPFQQKMG